MRTLTALMLSMTVLTTALFAHAVATNEGEQRGVKPAPVVERLTRPGGQQFAASHGR
jgi:hypothetical protein